MNGDAPDEYDLADNPESDESETDQPPTPKAQPTRAPGQPLPRMWKAEPEDEPAASPGRKRNVGKPADAGKSSKAGAGGDEPGEKKALMEETPAFDTYEARQRARMLTGGLIAGIVGLACYVGYQMFPKNPFPDGGPTDEDAMAQGPVEPAKPDLDVEARAMFVRAREFAKIGRSDEAVALLEKLVKAYKNTKTAGDAREALKRPAQNLPLFLDRPTVKADAPAVPDAEPTAPPTVVVARAPGVEAKGNATLVLPANPAELTPSQVSANATATPVSADRKLPPGFTAKTEAGMDPSGWPLLIVGDRDGAPMVFVPGGVFTMGDDRDAGFASPEHKVNLSGYYIDQHEVTVRQFRLFLSETRFRGRPPGNWPTVDETGKPSTEALPMVMVNAGDAQAYAEWAGKRLPTEAQWELAARSIDGRTYPWGDEPAKYARPRTARRIDPVKSFPEDKSPYGVFDMAGNVLEWTSDSFDPGYYRSIASQVVSDPTGAQPRSGKSDLVVKGGKTGAGAAREPMAAEKRLTYVGFRCALQVERPAVIATPVPTPAAAAPAPTQPPAGQKPAPANAAPPPVPF
ncbi:SUMF1/EgtB/PvdO family nonheme iron enzyme [Paludisphaera borealis]|uniref:Serine/threonine-protein kinase pkn1 n=1 Tax=Paludisphaera borealis TaxID=1387353 RepID=A0A1U7CKF6_9BACT|nr:SUMF1/EgtB/PvdO family nonheme iron enzyme [Paludisphaera borealis]APW59363.1 Serine/threonine-protein kinase pkn1 [Paludisphaera borealis]